MSSALSPYFPSPPLEPNITALRSSQFCILNKRAECMHASPSLHSGDNHELEFDYRIKPDVLRAECLKCTQSFLEAIEQRSPYKQLIQES